MKARHFSNTSLQRVEKLPAVIIDRIAAGEVIEGPASVVKELAENAIDAGASRLEIRTEAAGMTKIQIRDNGSGIYEEDLPLCLERHATSKIRNLEDIEAISSFGFRGEALSAISSVCHLEMKTISAGAEHGSRLRARGGEILEMDGIAWTEGTSITVEELFYATPARKNFIRSERGENQKIYKEILNIALVNHGVEITYFRDGKKYIHLPERKSVLERICDIYGNHLENNMQPIEGTVPGIYMHGYISKPAFHRSNRDGQYVFVNGRAVDLKHASFFVRKGYGELLPDRAHPWFFLFLEVDPERVDVNVHPAKKEVRLLDESLLHNLFVSNVERFLIPDRPFRIHDVRFPAKPVFHDPSFASEAPGGLVNEANTADQLFSGDTGTDHCNSYSTKEELFTPVDKIVNVREVSSVPVSHSNVSDNPSEERKRFFLPEEHYGIIFGTYILARGQDGFYIIDQHTAHERINYEKNLKALEQRRYQRQVLLQPLILKLLRHEVESVEDKTALLDDAGFSVEVFGPEEILLREVPDYIDTGSEIENLRSVIQKIIEGESIVRIYQEYAAMKACKASIKRNDYVSHKALSDILVQLSECEDPSRCPHGRPTMIRLSAADFDRMFDR